MHRPQKPVRAYEEALAALVADMVATMYDADGVGLAECQIGVEQEVFSPLPGCRVGRSSSGRGAEGG